MAKGLVNLIAGRDGINTLAVFLQKGLVVI